MNNDALVARDLQLNIQLMLAFSNLLKLNLNSILSNNMIPNAAIIGKRANYICYTIQRKSDNFLFTEPESTFCDKFNQSYNSVIIYLIQIQIKGKTCMQDQEQFEI